MRPLSICAIAIIALLAESAAGQDATQRCCPDNQVLDIELKKCVDKPAVFKTYQEESGRNDPNLQCANDGWATFKMENFSNSSAIVEPRFNQPLKNDQYCVNSVEEESNETVIVFCRFPVLQMKKCCPSGQSVNRTSVGECVPNERRQFNISKIVTPTGWPFEIVDNSSLQCKFDYNIYVPKMFVDNWFSVNATVDGGQLQVRKSMYKLLGSATEYCVDTAIDSKGDEEPFAMMCLPTRMYIIRFILWEVYSYLHFVSAFFLFLTLIVYCIFPTLRDNIQGWSMICFLICMIVVQTEYGVLLSLPREPHTWCFFKTQASNYFRYASSTWITVMGFNIWNQLCRTPFNKKDMLKRFALFSVYAWGVPLALQLAVIIYRDSLGPPVRLCWFGNPIIRHLLSLPNVVLVTANLIFFIPSALKVYGSLRFLKTSVSPVALSKLEKQRITTIFRFFLLMQFYTMPRIIHEIVDSDGASPELLLFSVSVYLLIGPAMFYFFVCKTEVFKMLAGLTTKIKETSSKTTNSSKISTGPKKFWRSRSYQTSMNNGSPHTSPTASNANIEPIKFQYNYKGEENSAFQNPDPDIAA